MGLGNLSSSEFLGPVLVSQDVEVEHGGYIELDLTATNEDPSFEYTISRQPMYGTIVGTPPIVYYLPGDGFLGYDRFYFSATNSLGQWSQASISVSVIPDTTTIYLRITGNDTTGTPDSLIKPYKTAQKAVETAIALSPSKTNRVVIDAGTGSFGNVILTDDFGPYVSWTISDLVFPVIGNITATGATGGNNVDGSRGWDITIDADPSFTFGNITSQGGNGGAATTRNTYGGKPGSITIMGITGNILSIPGSGQKLSDGTCLGQNGGNVLIEEDSEVGYILAEGTTCDHSGNGGNVIINGEVTGNVYAGGGSSGEGGNGGSVSISGTVIGTIYANGGSGDDGGNGGIVSISGTLTGDIEATGGSGTLVSGGKGGTAEIQIGSTLRDVNVSGGDGATLGGLGGDVTVIDAALRYILANGGASSFAGGGIVNIGGAGGAITLDGYAYAEILSALGGSCNNTIGGNGGTLYIHSSAIYNSDDSVYDPGTCNGGGTTGDVGSLTSF